jgi:hypothetical protein
MFLTEYTLTAMTALRADTANQSFESGSDARSARTSTSDQTTGPAEEETK